MGTVRIGFGVDDLAVYVRLVSEDTRPANMRAALAVAAEHGVPFDDAWSAVQAFYMGTRDGAWESVLRKTKPHWKAAYERDLAAWDRLTAEGRERQSAEWLRLPEATRERLAA